jgi:hypothetical protein
MHDIDRTQLETTDTPEAGNYAFEEGLEASGIYEGASPLTEIEEVELATELLGAANEAELDQFLGNLFKKAWKGIRRAGAAVGKIARPLAGVLKPIAKAALPMVGGALGSFIPVPGIGTALGTALGSAVSNALETELEGLSDEDREFEMARRFVRMAGTAARRAIQMPPDIEPRAAVIAAIKAALKNMQAGAAGGLPGGNGQAAAEAFETAAPPPPAMTGGSGRSGRWVRHGNKIILTGV